MICPRAASLSGWLPMLMVFIALTSSAAAGQSCSPSRAASVTVLFVNGIWNSPQDAAASCEELARLAAEAGISDVNIDLFYNRTQSDVCSAANVTGSIVAPCPQLGDLAEALVQYDNAMGGYAEPSQDDALRLAVVIANETQSGRAVVVVAHSQGNLMFQEAVFGRENGGSFASLRQRIGWLAIAAPYLETSPDIGAFASLIAAMDVLRPLRNGTQATRAGELENWTKRHLLSSYFSDPRYRAMIKSALREEVRALSTRGTPQTPAPQPVPAAPPRRVLLVIDLSSSMNDDGKIEEARRAATGMVDQLAPGSEVGVMTFGGRCEVTSATGFSADLAQVRQGLATLQAAGSTPLSSAMLSAAQYASQENGRGPIDVIVISDGMETCGGDAEAAARRLGEALHLTVNGGVP